MFKKLTAAVLSFALSFTCCAFANDQTNQNNSKNFNFEKDDLGFIPIFADYPTDDQAYDFYELDYGLKTIPIENAKNGLYISGNNHSDDLFMGYYKELTGFEPNQPLTFDISFKIATNVDGGLIGIGGSPGSSVYVKCGVTAQKPKTHKGDLNRFYLNIDKGNQATDGKDMKLVGTIEKHETTLAGKYEFNDYNATIETKTSPNGSVYLIIGTDSGFEGTTSYYIDSVNLAWSKKSDESYINDAVAAGIIENAQYATDEEITRLQFCTLAYNMINSVKELPVAKLSQNPFDDTNSPKINALAFSKIVSGKDERTFAPNDKINREQAAAVLYRICKFADLEMPEPKVDVLYSDNAEISPWALKEVHSLKTLDIIENSSGSLFSPKANCTAKDAVLSLVKLYKLIK